jgi:gliding motility-associated-like protein
LAELINGAGCSATDSIYVDVISQPTADFSINGNESCSPGIIALTDLSLPETNDPIITWTWLEDGGNLLSTEQNPSLELEGTFSPLENSDTIDITLIIETLAGCSDTLESGEQFILHQNPTASFASNPEITSLIDPRVQFNDNSSDNVSYWSWDFGNGYGSELQNPIFVFDDAGDYPITLMVESEAGCSDVVLGSVKIESPFTFYLPNSFSPNNDGLNDFFGGQGIGIIEFEMVIVNRWGEEVFYSSSENQKWDGKFKGMPIEMGVYSYKVNLVDSNFMSHKYLGAVTLLR